MAVITGVYNTAKIYTDTVEENAAEQIKALCDREFVKGCKIRIMPDVHAGAGCVIGFTADLGTMIIPNIVGVDIGCGMLTVELGSTELNFSVLDSLIRFSVPSGKNVHEGRMTKYPELQELHCYRNLKNTRWIERSLGTLGGGNHFIEIDKDDESNNYLVIHTGSRNLGKQVAEYYQSLAYDIFRGAGVLLEQQKKLIEDYKAAGRRNEIQAAIKQMKSDFKARETDIPKELCYLTGEYREMYLHDMKICQEFATRNRIEIANTILCCLFGKQLSDFISFETIHNYIDHDSNIVRKGAVSARSGEKLLIPINM
ncbi:MAG: RtcB family protein, partial [Oscillospiraceae bacterium]